MLYDLKVEGHELIDRMVELNVPRQKVYEKLAKRLKVQEPKAHFANMKSMEEVKLAIKHLDDMIILRKSALHAERIRAKTSKPKVSPEERERRHQENLTNRRGVILPLAQQKEALAKKASLMTYTIDHRETWSQKFIHLLHAILKGKEINKRHAKQEKR